MGRFTPISLEEAALLGARFGLDVVDVVALEAGSVNSNFELRTRDGQRYFARLYEEQGLEGAMAELRLLRELRDAGVPTTRPLEPLRPEVVLHAGKPFAVQTWVSGEILCHGRVTPAHCEEVGRALARLHCASGRCSAVSEGRFGISSLRQRLDTIERSASDYRQAARVIRERLQEYALRRDTSLPSGLIHGDLFRDNVLWEGERIAALIDFESACAGPFVFDLMVCLEAWCYGSRFEMDRVQALVLAYDRARSLSQREVDAFVVEGALAALRFATTRITDFSMRAPPGRPPARDYRRFLSRLDELESGALEPVQRMLSRR